MIILLIVLALVLVFCSWMLIKKTSIRWIVGIFSLLLLGGSVFLFTDHVLNHTGMKVKTTKMTEPIYSAGSTEVDYGVLVQQEIGTSSKKYVLVYRKDKEAAKPTAHFTPDFDHPAEMIKTGATYKYTADDQATVTTTVKRYRWDSDFSRVLYGFYGEDGQLISRKVVASVPRKTWLIVTQEQSKQLKAMGQEMKQQAILKQKELMEQHSSAIGGKQAPAMSTEELVNKLKTALAAEE